MALIIEDGTGVAGADSYATSAEYIAFVQDYFGVTVASDDPALRRAFYYMQGLRWKSGTYPLFGGAIPIEVKHAQTLFARAEQQSVGALSPDVVLSGSKTLVEVKGIKWTASGPMATVENSRPIVTAAFDFLRPYLEFDPARDGSIGITGVMVV
jgi:hypothetical protein